MKKAVYILFLLSSIALYGQTDDDIFGGIDSGALIQQAQPEAAVIKKEQGFNWSGSMRFGATLNGYYDLDASRFKSYHPRNPDDLDYLMGRDFSVDLIFAATNESFIDMYGRLRLQPFAAALEQLLNVKTLYTKFDIDNSVFFKAGKYAVDWGVGLFFTPTDVINLTAPDPHDINAAAEDTEGPVSVKMSIPFGMNYLALYGIIGDSLKDSGAACRFDWVLNNTQLSVGGYYRHNDDLAAIATLSGAIGRINSYLGGVFHYGDNYPAATVGVSYSVTDDAGWFAFTIAGQYYMQAVPLTFPDHYAGGRLSWREMFASDVTFNATYTHNFADLSCRITPSLSWQIDQAVRLTAALPLSFGEAGGEYAPNGNTLGGNLTLFIGGGSF